jgi:hypothetical protein
MNNCPVCGFDKLLYPIEESPICPSCYTEFGFDDEIKTFKELRADWIKDGMPWRGKNVQPPPIGWNPYVQLTNLQKTQPSTVTRNSSVKTVKLGRTQHRLDSDVIIFGHLQIMGNLGGVSLAHG